MKYKLITLFKSLWETLPGQKVFWCSFKFVSIFFYKTSPHKLKNWHSQDVDLDLWSLDVISMILKQLQYTYFNLTYLNYQYW